MPEFKDLPQDFCCPDQDGCPYLQGLSTRWVWVAWRVEQKKPRAQLCDGNRLAIEYQADSHVSRVATVATGLGMDE